MQTKQTLTQNLTHQLNGVTSQVPLSIHIANAKPTLHLRRGMGLYQTNILISEYSQFIEGILRLGVIEHTGDWDPRLIIALHDGTELITSYGYPEIILHQNTILKIYLGLLQCYTYGFLTEQDLIDSDGEDLLQDITEEDLNTRESTRQKLLSQGVTLDPNCYDGDDYTRMLSINISSIKSLQLILESNQ